MPYELRNTKSDESLFFRMSEAEAEAHGAIGYLRADFGKSGNEFHTTWFDFQTRLKAHKLTVEFDDIINSLREDSKCSPLGNRNNLIAYCETTPCKDLGERGYGYIVRTPDYSYYFRCRPTPHDYDVYCFVYDNRYHLPTISKTEA